MPNIIEMASRSLNYVVICSFGQEGQRNTLSSGLKLSLRSSLTATSAKVDYSCKLQSLDYNIYFLLTLQILH